MAALNENAITRLATVTAIDATATGATTLYTVPPGKALMVTKVVIRVITYTEGSKSVQVVASFGGNSATYDDYLDGVTYTVATSGVYIVDEVTDSATVAQSAADIFKIIIDTASNATTETWAVDVFGYLV